MNLLQYLIVNIISIAFSWLAWFFLLFYVNPFTAPIFLVVLFYLSLFIAVASTVSFFELVLRILVLKRKIIPYEAAISFRQGILFSFLTVSCLFLTSKNLFTWWILTIFIILLLAIEFFFISTRRAQ